MLYFQTIEKIRMFSKLYSKLIGRIPIHWRMSKAALDKLEEDKVAQEQALFYKRRDFYAQFVAANDLCFDVGANIGNRIGPLLELGARVVAVEPQKECYEVLNENFGNRIEIVKKGLSGKEGKEDFYISDVNVVSSFSPEFIKAMKGGRFRKFKWKEKIEVEMTTLDVLINRFGSPRFIKIDVEGYELEVLKGLSNPVAMISFEYTVPELLDNVVKCIEQIEKTGAVHEYNYSVGESMDFELNTWLSIEKMKNHISEKGFSETLFGDVYCRVK